MTESLGDERSFTRCSLPSCVVVVFLVFPGDEIFAKVQIIFYSFIQNHENECVNKIKKQRIIVDNLNDSLVELVHDVLADKLNLYLFLHFF